MDLQALPTAIDAERALLGALLIDLNQIYDVRAVINTEELYRRSHQWVYQAMCDLADQGKALDFVVIVEELARRPGDQDQSQLESIGGAAFLTQLVNEAPNIIARRYFEPIQQTAIQRRLIRAAAQAAAVAHNAVHPDTGEPMDAHELVAYCENLFLQIEMSRLGTRASSRHILDVLSDILQKQEKMMAGETVDGIYPGIPGMAEMLPYGVWPKGWMVVIGANPKLGKSMIAAYTIALNIVRGKNIYLVGTEMLAEENLERMIPMITKILKDEEVETIPTADLLRQVNGPQDDEGIEVKFETIGKLQQLFEYLSEKCDGNLVIVDEPLKVSELRAKIARDQLKWGTFDMVVIDHIGMLLPEGKVYSDTQRMTEISSDVRTLSRTGALGNPVVLAISPFTKGEKTEKPDMNRFRSTFMLAHDAHLLCALYASAAGHLTMNIVGMRASNPSYDGPDEITLFIDKETGIIKGSEELDLNDGWEEF